MSGNSTIFSGASRYSTDFQSVIDRAVSIASLPLNVMQSVKTRLGDESSALGSLDSKISAFQSVLTGLANTTGSSSLTSSVSDDKVLRPAISSGAFEGSYSFRVVSLGAYTSVMSSAALPAVTDPALHSISTAEGYTLTVDGTEYAVAPKGTSLNDLAAAINALPDANVQATVVNLGSDPADYHLSLQSKKLGPVAIQLNAGAQTLMDTAGTPATSLVTGSKAQYKVGASPTLLESSSRTITLSSGLTVEMLKQMADTDPAVTVSVSRSGSTVSSALGALATAYNAVMTELDRHRGSSGGSLSGSSIVPSIAQSLRNMMNFSGGSGGVTSLTDLGLNFDKSGRLSVDSTTFSSATSAGFSKMFDFLGESKTGGFLKAATDALNAIEDTTSGSLKTAISSTNSQVTAQDKAISAQQDRIDLLQKNMTAQMAAADALIASMEQQVSYFTNMFQAMADNSKNL